MFSKSLIIILKQIVVGVILAKVETFVQRVLIVGWKKSRTRRQMGQNDPFRRSSVMKLTKLY